MTMKVHSLAAARKPRRPRRSIPSPESRSGPVNVQRVNAGVMRTALRIAGGDASKLVIVNPMHVEVFH